MVKIAIGVYDLYRIIKYSMFQSLCHHIDVSDVLAQDCGKLQC